MLDVLVWGDVSKADLARNLHKLYRGTHVTHPKARTCARAMSRSPRRCRCRSRWTARGRGSPRPHSPSYRQLFSFAFPAVIPLTSAVRA